MGGDASSSGKFAQTQLWTPSLFLKRSLTGEGGIRRTKEPLGPELMCHTRWNQYSRSYATWRSRRRHFREFGVKLANWRNIYSRGHEDDELTNFWRLRRKCLRNAPVCGLRICARHVARPAQSNPLVSKLKSGALKDRHYSRILGADAQISLP